MLVAGRVWCGHNIVTFDNKRCVRRLAWFGRDWLGRVPPASSLTNGWPPSRSIVEHFERLGRTPPRAAGIIDTLPLLRKHWPKARAGDHKMASLGRCDVDEATVTCCLVLLFVCVRGPGVWSDLCRRGAGILASERRSTVAWMTAV